MGSLSGHTDVFAAGWSSLVARRAHNPKVVGSNPTPATTRKPCHGRVSSLLEMAYRDRGISP